MDVLSRPDTVGHVGTTLQMVVVDVVRMVTVLCVHVGREHDVVFCADVDEFINGVTDAERAEITDVTLSRFRALMPMLKASNECEERIAQKERLNSKE